VSLKSTEKKQYKHKMTTEPSTSNTRRICNKKKKHHHSIISLLILHSSSFSLFSLDLEDRGIEYWKKVIESEEEFESDGWECFFDKDKTKIWRKQKSGSSLYTYRGRTMIEDTEGDFFFDFYKDLRYHKAWDDYVAKLKVCKKKKNKSQNFFYLIQKYV